MNANGWELIYTDDFLEALVLIHRYVATQSEACARKLSSGLMNFTIAVIYKVESDSLIYVDVYHTSRNKGIAGEY